jgi:predicted RND superfamily exporter protein
MRKRVFRSICLACFITLLLTAMLVISVIYNNSAEVLKKEVINQSIFISKALESDADADMEYIAAIGKESENRISLISPDGTVIYDSFVKADTLENHLDRPEIKSAISNGSGDATRLSDTLGEKTYYYAVKLNNGVILRVAATSKSAFGIISGAMIWIVLIAVVILVLAVISARFLTVLIIKPINNLNLEEPLSNSTYEELSPLLKNLDERDRSAKEISDEIRALTKDIPGAEISVAESSTMMMGMATGAISISIKGDDIDTLKTIGDDFKKIIERVEGTREVTTSYEDGIPQVQVITDRNIASQYGLTTAQIGSSITNAMSGSNVTKFKVNGDEIDVVLKGDNIYGESISYLEMLPVETPMGTTVPLSEVARIRVEKGPISIQRENQVRVLTVSGSVVGRDIQSASQEIEDLLNDYEMPFGYTYKFGGEVEQIEETFTDLFLVMLLAVALVYMIIAAQFESLIQPLSIMFSVPLALSGGFIGLFVTGLPLNVIGIIGLIILVGIVVNNAIVLVDYINKRRGRGEDRDAAIMKAGPIRIRPIMMTALTTILGLLPMSLGIGEGAELSQSMGVVVIGGLSLSTVLTLVIIPVMYTIFDDISEFFKRKIKREAIREITE